MKTWNGLEGYHNGAIYSRLNDIPLQIQLDKYVLCTIPRLFTPHCSNELKAADDIYQEFTDADIPVVFASTDSPEAAEQYFGAYPVSFPFIRISPFMERDLGVIDRFGDAMRSTYYIKDGNIVDVQNHGFDNERDMWHVLQKAKEVLL